jgi:AcrR family transcriptional regulator
VHDAAMRLYARTGWSGFTFEAVAREAEVGKPALYRRWPSREVLLTDAFRARWFVVEQIDTGNLRDDLLALARMSLTHLASSYGRAVLHMQLDRAIHPEVAAATSDYTEGVQAASRRIVLRGIERHELAAGTSATLVLDVVFGASFNHVVSTPPHLLPRVVANLDTFATSLVDGILLGLAPR